MFRAVALTLASGSHLLIVSPYRAHTRSAHAQPLISHPSGASCARIHEVHSISGTEKKSLPEIGRCRAHQPRVRALSLQEFSLNICASHIDAAATKDGSDTERGSVDAKWLQSRAGPLCGGRSKHLQFVRADIDRKVHCAERVWNTRGVAGIGQQFGAAAPLSVDNELVLIRSRR